MHVIIGGAYSGKRQYVRDHWRSFQFISAYEEKTINELVTEDTVVYEGFEIWIREQIDRGKTNDEIVNWFRNWLASLKNPDKTVLIMLEIGKGIVPMEEQNRRMRDLVGWIQQEAVRQANTVTSIWHGLAMQMKNIISE